MSNSDDILKLLQSMHGMLKKSQEQGTSFAGSGFGNINIEAAQELAEKLKESQNNIKTADEYMQGFIDSAKEAAKRVNEGGSGFKRIGNILKEIDKASGSVFAKIFKKTGIDKFYKGIIKVKNGIQGWAKALKKAEGGAQKLHVALQGIVMTVTAFIAIIAAITLGVVALGVAITKSVVNAFSSAFSAATKLAKFIYTLPVTIANRAAEIGHKLRQEVVEVIGQAVENTKEMFDLASNGGSAFIRLGSIAKGSLLSFQSVNSTMTKLFGFGAAGAAKMVADVTKNISDMTVFADVFADSTTKSGKSIEFITRMTKGMAMGSDGLNYVVREAIKNGEHYFETMTRMKESSDAVSEEFGLNRKLLSSNFFQLRKDIVNFGHLSDIELQRVAARATQMGVEMKDVVGIFNKFSTFEDAANSAALLSQTFGMNIDALQLIRAEDPNEIIEMFRHAMHATGRSFDDLNRHEKSLMASHTGLSAEALKTVMNYRTLGKSFEEIKKIMNDQKPEERQIKAMKDMSSSMSEVQKIMSEKDFFESFTKGMTQTILYGTKLGAAYKRVSKNMENFYESGLRVDKKILNKAFEPFAKLLDEVNNMFKAGTFKNMMENAIKEIGEFINDVFDPNSQNQKWEVLSSKWRTKISDIFSLDAVITGNSYFGKATAFFGKIVGYLIKGFTLVGPEIIKGVVDVIDGVLSFFTGGGYKSSLDSKTVASFLGMTEATWNDVKADLVKKFEDLKLYLFGGQITLTNGITQSIEGKIPTIVGKMGEIFGTVIPWETIGQGFVKVLRETWKIAGPTIKEIFIEIANAMAVAIGELLGLKIKDKMELAEKNLDKKINALKLENTKESLDKAAQLEKNRGKIIRKVGGQEARKSFMSKPLEYTTFLPLKIGDWITGTDASGELARGITDLISSSPEQQLQENIRSVGIEDDEDLSYVGRVRKATNPFIKKSEEAVLTQLSELSSSNLLGMNESSSNPSRELINDIIKEALSSNTVTQELKIMIDNNVLGNIVLDKIISLSEQPATSTGFRTLSGNTASLNRTQA